ncbi:cation diffusion facilitator family transporter [Segetibacter sp.]|uniref:cation diffusion facilitator family transporter n=1 Tax=Segetibacter sp. TaxID=2231182 RepID=UPI00262A8EC7|nr:cation diffusion facilitator family transporter [Segetibacter sp.]MCW3081594.1 cation transporter [Segetibacter sp.]
MQSASYNLKVQKWITALSVVLLMAKVVAYHLTNSLAILTDALESIVNVIAGGIGLYSLFVAAKPKDEEHPYGHGKAEFVSAAVEGTLIVAAGVVILYQTAIHFITPNQIGKLDAGLIMVGATAIVNYCAGVVCLKIGKRNHSLALQASGRHLQTDTWSTLAIIVGLLLMVVTRLYWLDKAIAVLMAAYIIYNGYKIIRESLAGIMDEQDMQLLQEIVDFLNKNRRVNWIDLHNFRIIKYGSHLHIDCHLTVPWYLNVHEAQSEIDTLMSLITEEFGTAIEFFVHTDGCLAFSCPLCDKFSCPVRQHAFEHKVEWTLDNLLTNQMHRLKKDAV